MKNYSFIIQEEPSTFILNYFVSKDAKYLMVTFANGKSEKFENNGENERRILEKMKKQINAAYAQVHNATAINRARGLKSYIAIKTKVKDIEKNKLFMDNLEHINQCLHAGALWKLYLPFYLQDWSVWEKENLSLNEADCFSLREVQSIVNSAEQYSQIWIDFSKQGMQKQMIR